MATALAHLPPIFPQDLCPPVHPPATTFHTCCCHHLPTGSSRALELLQSRAQNTGLLQAQPSLIAAIAVVAALAWAFAPEPSWSCCQCKNCHQARLRLEEPHAVCPRLDSGYRLAGASAKRKVAGMGGSQRGQEWRRKMPGDTGMSGRQVAGW